MAADSRSRDRVPYRLLHKLSTVDLVYDDSKVRKKKRKTIGLVEAERVVARKKKIERYIASIPLARHS